MYNDRMRECILNVKRYVISVITVHYKASELARKSYAKNKTNIDFRVEPEPRIVLNEVFVEEMIKKQYNIDMMEAGE